MIITVLVDMNTRSFDTQRIFQNRNSLVGLPDGVCYYRNLPQVFGLLVVHHLSKKTDYPFSHRLIGCSMLTQACAVAIPVPLALLPDHVPAEHPSGSGESGHSFHILT